MAENTMKTLILTLTLIITGSLFSPVEAQRSLYRDLRAHEVGDIITVVLMENISGSSTSDSRVASNASANAESAASGNFLPFEPTFGAGSKVDYDSDLTNLATQRQLLEGFLSVQIVEVTATGDLLVEGMRYTDINGEKHEMSLRGVVREVDINGMNQVPSFRIANAEISYKKQGGFMNHKEKRGAVKRIALGVVSAGVSVALIMRSMGN